MKAMIWKELRENFKWAVLACAGMLLAEFYVLGGLQKDFYSEEFTLCSSTFLMVTSFGSALVGAALGAVQILPERRRDQWAALLHRPVPRGTIFFGKVAAGLLLYSFATVLPFLLSVWFVATPGSFAAPFIPGTMLPGLSDLLVGVVFYFAAFLVCLGQGKWFGAKGMILLAALAVLLLHMACADGVVALPLIAAILLMLAGRGAMLGNGPMRDMPRLGRAGYILMVLAGAQTALVLLTACAHFLLNKENANPNYELNFVVTNEGQLLRWYWWRNATTDPDGKPVTDPRYLNDDRWNYLSQFYYVETGPYTFPRNYQSIWDLRNSLHYIAELRTTPESPESWSLMIRRNYIVGYDKLSRHCLGYFDQNGFEPPGQRPIPFSAPILMADYGNWSTDQILASGTRVYDVDSPDRTMTTIFDAKDRVVRGTANFNAANQAQNLVAVATDDEVSVVDYTGKFFLSIPYPHDLKRWNAISIATDAAHDRIFLQSENNDFGSAAAGSAALPLFVDEYDLKGNLLQSYSFPDPPPVPTPPQLVDRLIGYSGSLGTLAVLSGYLPLTANSAIAYSWWLMAFPQALGEWAGILVFALVLGAITFFWARKTGFSNKSALGWSAFVFFFGPAGLLTFRLATDWPVRVRCPACGRKRAIEADQCDGCHQLWIHPQRNGTEILDSPAFQQL
jgi:ABC-type transport system involved in multi-copper enzyme maturation permease subunit